MKKYGYPEKPSGSRTYLKKTSKKLAAKTKFLP